MAVRVGILAFDTARKREQDRLRSLELIRSLFQFQEGTHAGQEFGAINRRLRKSSAPTRNAFDAILFVGERITK